jgi:hypothetical protein
VPRRPGLDVVHLDAERVDHQQIVAPLVVEGVEHDPHPIVGPGVVAVGEMDADRRRIRVEGAERDVERAVVVKQQHLGADRRRGVLARAHLDRQLGRPGLLPDNLVERAVDLDRRLDPGDLAARPGLLWLGLVREGREGGHHRQRKSRQSRCHRASSEGFEPWQPCPHSTL